MRKRVSLPNIAVIGILSFLLSGCAGLLDPGAPMTQVILPVQITVAATSNRMPMQVLVAHPVADTATGTDRIMALMNGYEVRALDSAKWVASVPWLVQRSLIDSLEASRRLQAVGWEESSLDAKVRLTTDIRRFYLRYDTQDAPPTVDIRLIFSLVDMNTAKIISRKVIAIEQQCTNNSVHEFVAAFSECMTKILEQTNAWVIDVLEARVEKAS